MREKTFARLEHISNGVVVHYIVAEQQKLPEHARQFQAIPGDPPTDSNAPETVPTHIWTIVSKSVFGTVDEIADLVKKAHDSFLNIQKMIKDGEIQGGRYDLAG